MDLAAQEAEVRRYAVAGLSQREIAAKVDLSQSTVHRTLQRINTGPHPISGPQPALTPYTRRLLIPWRAVMLVAVALLVLAASIGTFTWMRGVRVPATQVTACVRYSPAGAITGITPVKANHCPARWKVLVLNPAK